VSDKMSVYQGHKGFRKNDDRPSKSKRGKRSLNRYQLETSSDETFSVSAKKLNLDEDSDEWEISGLLGYRFINLLPVLMTLSQLLVCKKCHSEVRFEEKSKRGLGFKIAVNCEKCKSHEINSCPMIKSHAYDINYRITLAMRLLGVGLHGIRKFCAFMELPHPIYHSCYDKFMKTIGSAVSNVCLTSITNAALEEIRLSKEADMNDGISVSGDGSWRKRRFSSLFGVSTLIGWFSSKVIDFIVKSKYCKRILV